jgi:integrase/recombinase XerD
LSARHVRHDVVTPIGIGSIAAPFLQDLIIFAVNTGVRVAEIFSLHWSHVDLEKDILNVFAPKTGKTRPVLINSEARRVLEAWAPSRKNDFAFYNHNTADSLLISKLDSLSRAGRPGFRV